MCSNYGAMEVKSLTIYMGGPTYTRHHEQSLTLPLALGVAYAWCRRILSGLPDLLRLDVVTVASLPELPKPDFLRG